MSGRRRRMLVWAAVVAVVAVLVALAVMPAAIGVETARVVRGDLEVTLDREGITRVRDRFVVSAPVAGSLERIVLEPGDGVRAGETVLATIEPTSASLLDERRRREAEAAVGAARAGFEQARADRAAREAEARFAAAELERYRRLAAAGVVSAELAEGVEAAAESAIAAARAAGSRVEAALSELERAQATLIEPAEAGDGGARVAVRSPVDGVVLRRMRESAGPVAVGEPLLELGDPARLEVVADFLSTDAVRVEVGMEARIDGWGGDDVLEGRVRRVDPSGVTEVSALGVDEQRVDVVVAPEGGPWERLGDRFRAEVAVVVWRGEDVLKAPAGALFRGPDGAWSVFVADGGEASLRAVEVGHRTGAEAEILAGLEEGDEVVLHPPDDLEDGGGIERLGSGR